MEKFLEILRTVASSRLFVFAMIMVAGILAIQIVVVLTNRAMKKTKMEKAAHGLIRGVIRTFLYLLLGVIAASSLGIDVTGVIALASVFTLALSLSVQNALTNLIGGFTLLCTKPFASGDYVEIADQSGTVSEIGMAYTKLITPDNRIVHIPNSAVVSANVVNYTVTGTRRLAIDISAAYSAPTQTVLEALKEAADVPGVLEDPAVFVALTGYGKHAVNYTVRVWTKTEDYWDVNFAVQEQIRECFEKRGVEMTYPHLNVHMDK